MTNEQRMLELGAENARLRETLAIAGDMFASMSSTFGRDLKPEFQRLADALAELAGMCREPLKAQSTDTSEGQKI